jgi:hypothetical protein
MRSLNKKETKKIETWLKSIGATITDNTGNILWHATIPYNGPMVYRDHNKTLVKVKNNYFNVYFEAGVNPGGVGDGLKPDPALTYSIGTSIASNERGYRCKNWYDTSSRERYSYDRTLEGMKSKLIKHLIENNAVLSV